MVPPTGEITQVKSCAYSETITAYVFEYYDTFDSNYHLDTAYSMPSTTSISTSLQVAMSGAPIVYDVTCLSDDIGPVYEWAVTFVSDLIPSQTITKIFEEFPAVPNLKQALPPKEHGGSAISLISTDSSYGDHLYLSLAQINSVKIVEGAITRDPYNIAYTDRQILNTNVNAATLDISVGDNSYFISFVNDYSTSQLNFYGWDGSHAPIISKIDWGFDFVVSTYIRATPVSVVIAFAEGETDIALYFDIFDFSTGFYGATNFGESYSDQTLHGLTLSKLGRFAVILVSYFDVDKYSTEAYLFDDSPSVIGEYFLGNSNCMYSPLSTAPAFQSDGYFSYALGNYGPLCTQKNTLTIAFFQTHVMTLFGMPPNTFLDAQTGYRFENQYTEMVEYEYNSKDPWVETQGAPPWFDARFDGSTFIYDFTPDPTLCSSVPYTNFGMTFHHVCGESNEMSPGYNVELNLNNEYPWEDHTYDFSAIEGVAFDKNMNVFQDYDQITSLIVTSPTLNIGTDITYSLFYDQASAEPNTLVFSSTGLPTPTECYSQNTITVEAQDACMETFWTQPASFEIHVQSIPPTTEVKYDFTGYVPGQSYQFDFMHADWTYGGNFHLEVDDGCTLNGCSIANITGGARVFGDIPLDMCDSWHFSLYGVPENACNSDNTDVTVEVSDAAPIPGTPITDPIYASDTDFNFTIPEGTFTDLYGRSIFYDAQWVGASWLSFYPTENGGYFLGHAPLCSVDVQIQIIADSLCHREQRYTDFTLKIEMDPPTFSGSLDLDSTTHRTSEPFSVTFDNIVNAPFEPLYVSLQQGGGDAPWWLSSSISYNPLTFDANITISSTEIDPDQCQEDIALTLFVNDECPNVVSVDLALSVVRDPLTLSGSMDPLFSTVGQSFSMSTPDDLFNHTDGRSLFLSISYPELVDVPDFLNNSYCDSYLCFLQTTETWPLDSCSPILVTIDAQDVCGSVASYEFDITPLNVAPIVNENNIVPDLLINMTSAIPLTSYSVPEPFGDQNGDFAFSISAEPSDGSLLSDYPWISIDTSNNSMVVMDFAVDASQCPTSVELSLSASDPCGESVSYDFLVELEIPPPMISEELKDWYLENEEWFSYTLPHFNSSFPGEILTVFASSTEDGTGELPDWIIYYPENNRITGVPTSELNHEIFVIAYGECESNRYVDSFTIAVAMPTEMADIAGVGGGLLLMLGAAVFIFLAVFRAPEFDEDEESQDGSPPAPEQSDVELDTD